MKKLYIIFLVLLTSLSSYAQDPQLFENDWYLQNVIIDGQDNFPPSNNEVPYVSISFFQNNSFVNTSVCDWLDGTLIFINSQFTFDSWSTSFGGCSGPFAQENLLFQGIYLGTFYQNNINDSFLYNITGEGNNKTLMIISSSGDEAIYSSVLLSTQDYLVNSFSFYPNPVKEFVYP